MLVRPLWSSQTFSLVKYTLEYNCSRMNTKELIDLSVDLVRDGYIDCLIDCLF